MSGKSRGFIPISYMLDRFTVNLRLEVVLKSSGFLKVSLQEHLKAVTLREINKSGVTKHIWKEK